MFNHKKELSGEIFDRALSIITVKPKELVARLTSADPEEQRAMANVFGGVLKLALDGLTGSSWSALGLDKASIYKILEFSKNPKLKSYFDEKIASLK